MPTFPPPRVPTYLLIGTGAVVFLANAGLLVLQLVGGRFLAPFIGSSVETWTCVIGVFLTGIALGNWFGGWVADRFPAPRTVAVLLVLGGLGSLSMIAFYELTLSSGFYRSIPLTPRIPLLAFLFCLTPAFFLSLLTPVSIKLLLPDVGNAGRIAGLVFAVSTLGCLVGNYFTGFWLMAYFTLNEMTMGVGIGLLVLSIPVFFVRRTQPIPTTAEANEPAPVMEESDGGWDFRQNIRLAQVIVFISSFCGMSLELTGVRLLAPTLGVSLYTWTGIIGVMLAGTAAGNYLGGVLADRGVGPALRRFALLISALIGAAAAPVVAREALPGDGPGEDFTVFVRLVGALVGGLCVIPGLWLSKCRGGAYIITAVVGGLMGAVLAHTAGRALSKAANVEFFTKFHQTLTDKAGFDIGPWLIHGVGFLFGATIALLFVSDAPKKGERITRSGALSGSFFLAALCAIFILLLSGIFMQYNFMYKNPDIVQKVLSWTFGLFFLPMLFLGTISPQVIRLSIPDVRHAGRVAGRIYAVSTIGAIAGTFATGYFLISSIGTYRVVMVLAFLLVLLAFFIGRLWKNNAMLYGASLITGGAIFGLFYMNFGSNRYDLETKYYAIKVSITELDDHRRVKLALDHLTHSIVDLDDPLWLGYKHEYVQGELLILARSRNPETNLLVIGGGGYTFPRYAEIQLPDVHIDVVEIDPGVTEIAHEKLNLPRDTAIKSYHLDGRQFVSERAKKKHYQLVMQDAVNDLSVPYHLMTREYNNAVKELLTPDGAYMLTLIDSLRHGQLYRAAVHTMRETFKYVYLLSPGSFLNEKNEVYEERHVFIIYGADQPLSLEAVQSAFDEHEHAGLSTKANAVAAVAPMVPYLVREMSPWWRDLRVVVLDDKTFKELMSKGKKIILTDQYCPVDNLMSDVFREREKGQR